MHLIYIKWVRNPTLSVGQNTLSVIFSIVSTNADRSVWLHKLRERCNMMLRILTGICLCFSFIEAHNDEHNPRFRRSLYEVCTLHIKQKLVKLSNFPVRQKQTIENTWRKPGLLAAGWGKWDQTFSQEDSKHKHCKEHHHFHRRRHELAHSCCCKNLQRPAG